MPQNYTKNNHNKNKHKNNSKNKYKVEKELINNHPLIRQFPSEYLFLSHTFSPYNPQLLI